MPDATISPDAIIQFLGLIIAAGGLYQNSAATRQQTLKEMVFKLSELQIEVLDALEKKKKNTNGRIEIFLNHLEFIAFNYNRNLIHRRHLRDLIRSGFISIYEKLERSEYIRTDSSEYKEIRKLYGEIKYPSYCITIHDYLLSIPFVTTVWHR
ncbi:MAG: hypothetical protein M1530_00070 [Candidatus Marsarchaeota archaeon]|nr:hypothetical protein [Candidatus Marsarchaeota archaeon]